MYRVILISGLASLLFAACSAPAADPVPTVTPAESTSAAPTVSAMPSAVAPALLPEEPPPDGAGQFTTDFSRHTVSYSEILSGGPPKDGIPAIDAPQLVSVAEADAWLEPQEPVVLVEVGDDARAYPIQVLMWHEIANDTVGGIPVAVTFCPLCNTAIVFDRRVGERTLDFSTAGRLRYSNLIMYDRQTESWWQQASGEAIVGELAGFQLSYLRDTDIFRDLEHAEVEVLGKRAPMQHVPAGTVFFSPEQAAEVLFILKEGRVRLYHLSPDGKALTTAVLEPGTIFGEMALLGQRLHQSYAESLSPCLLCLMSREDVKTMLLSDPRIATRVAEILGQRLIVAEQRLSDFAFKNLPERLASLLLQLGRPPKPRLFRPSGGSPEVRFTHEALAEMAGTYRETATKILNEFRARGLIELKRGYVILVDEAGLRALSERVEGATAAQR